MEQWKPQIGEVYYFLHSYGDSDRAHWLDSKQDNSRFEIGNCFKSQHEANARLPAVSAALRSGNKINELKHKNFELEQENKELSAEVDRQKRLVSAWSERLAGKDAEIKFYQNLISEKFLQEAKSK